MAWKRRALKWGGWSGGSLALLLAAGIALFVWAAQEFTRYRPLDLTAQVAKVGAYVLPEGVSLSAGKAELYFDDGPILKVNGLGVKGADGQLGVFVDQVAVKFATTQLLMLSAAPKHVEADGVTLRLVRGAEGISIAGLTLKDNADRKGVVDWLNAMGWSPIWGRLKQVEVTNANLLVRDDVQNAEWVLENANLNMSRYPDDGERGTLTAFVRRLYGDGDALKLDNIPVLVTFQHAPGAEGLDVLAKLEGADAGMVADYLPAKLQDLLRAKGEVEVGTRVLEGNKLEQPWVTLKLQDVTVHPGEAFSKPLKLPKLDVTVSYIPPAAEVSPSDVLRVRRAVVTTERGSLVEVSGTISDLQGDMLVDLSLASPKGEVQGVFDFFPDKPRGFARALEWLRPNIIKGEYQNLTAHYKGRPSAFPGCGEACGVLEIDTAFTGGRVRFLDDITPVDAAEGRMQWRGQTLTVTAPLGLIKGTGGTQTGRNVVVSMDKIFDPSPTELRVRAEVDGPAGGLMAELNQIEELQGKVPQGIGGRHRSWLDIYVPLPRGQKASFASSTLLVSSTIADVTVKGLPQLKGAAFEGPLAVVSLDAAKRLRVLTEGQLGGQTMNIDWSQSLAPAQPDLMVLKAKGFTTGAWLMKHVSTTLLGVEGVVGVNLDLAEQVDGAWRFAATANGAQAKVDIPAVKYSKAVNAPLTVDARGSYEEGTLVALEKLDVLGKDLSVGGALKWNIDRPADSVVNLPTVRIGQSRIGVQMAQGDITLNGELLDLSGYDLFGDDKGKPDETLDNLLLNLDVKTLRLKGGELNNVTGVVRAKKGRWGLRELHAGVDGKRVDISRSSLPRQAGRSRMTFAVEDLGRTLEVVGLYDKITGGRLSGEITYDREDVGGGVVRIENFELENPSLLVQLLSLLSLEQLLSGTSSTMFKVATLPVRVDGDVWTLDNASLEGPSMDLRLSGTYNTAHKEMNIDGKLAPGIPLNRLVGKIPLLGTILTGSQDGVVVADFKLKGPTSDPQINVRPLSVITPGLLKDIWRGVTQ